MTQEVEKNIASLVSFAEYDEAKKIKFNFFIYDLEENYGYVLINL